MKINLKKTGSALLASAILFTNIPAISCAKSFKQNMATPYAWAGRPGGHDGAEEWAGGNQGSIGYGETNGPYKVVSIRHGRVSRLNEIRNISTNVALELVGFSLGQIPSIIAKGAGWVHKVVGIFGVNKDFPGYYYKSTFSVSGRRAIMKFEFYNSN